MSGKVILLSGDGQKIEITRPMAEMSELMKSMLADDDDPDDIPEIPLLEVSYEIMLRVVMFLEKHVNDPMKEITKPIATNKLVEIVGEWDDTFISYLDTNQTILFKVILAANYLDIPSLLDLGICKIACMVKGREPDEVKKMFNIEPDITPEEVSSR